MTTGKAQRKQRTPTDFLMLMHPNGPWCLTAISPDKKGTETKTFWAGDEPEMEDWIAARDGVKNLYFHVNPVRGTLNSKASRGDIKAVTHFHVDVDPEGDEDPAEFVERALDDLKKITDAGFPYPTTGVASGGGLQFFWQLKDPIVIDGDIGLAEDAKLFNVQIERVFNADNCHDICRLMRVAGTMNLPDAKKITKGRQKAQAKVLFHNPKNVYAISQFKKAAPVQDSGLGTKAGGGADVKIDTKVEVTSADLEALRIKHDLSRSTCVAIGQGGDPDNPKEGDNSRSAWVFHVCCELARKEVPDDIIFSLLTDPEWGISESVLEAKDPAKYAVRQISRAKQYAIDPDLGWMNDAFCVLRAEGGKLRVMSFGTDDWGNPSIVLQTRADFENGWCNKKKEVIHPDGKVGFKPLGKWWFEHPKRRTLDALRFDPSTTDEVLDGRYRNLWKGFAVEPVEGDCGLYLDHLKHVVCNGIQEHFEYLIRYLAYGVQHPGRPAEVAMVLQGGKGTGKSFTVSIYCDLFGQHAAPILQPNHLTGNFNGHLTDKCVVFADEAATAGDAKAHNVLKGLITERTITIERKGLDPVRAKNNMTIIMASNDPQVVNASDDERRYFVLKLSNDKAQNHDYFGALSDQMDNGGREALLHYLLNFDLGDFHPRKNIPQTDALREQKLLSLPPVEQWMFNVLQEGVLDGATVKTKECHQSDKTIASQDADTVIGKDDRGYDIKERRLGIYSQIKMAPGCRDLGPQVLAKMLKDYGFRSDRAHKQPMYWVAPSLKEARMLWAMKHGEVDWDRDVNDWDAETMDDDVHAKVPHQGTMNLDGSDPS